MHPTAAPQRGDLSIGRLARRSGVHLETIRYYERIGLLAEPPRTTGGHRQYGAAHVRRLNFIRRGRELGFTLDQIRALLRLADERDRRCVEARAVAAAHLAEIRAKLADLRAMEAALQDMVAECGDGTLADCPLIEALYGHRPPAA